MNQTHKNLLAMVDLIKTIACDHANIRINAESLKELEQIAALYGLHIYKPFEAHGLNDYYYCDYIIEHTNKYITVRSKETYTKKVTFEEI